MSIVVNEPQFTKLVHEVARVTGSLETVFSGLQGMRIGALVVSGEPFFDSQRDKIVGLAAKYAVLTIYAWREYVLAGGLMSYGTDLPESYRQAAIYAGRILKGEKPANFAGCTADKISHGRQFKK
jgi:putative tryptophan/tyrosine transport system substrate-binding protein